MCFPYIIKLNFVAKTWNIFLFYFIICHIRNYTEYNQQWNVFSVFDPSKCTHTWSSGQPTLRQVGVRWLAQGSHLSRGQMLPEPRFEPTTLDYKSNALSIRPHLPLDMICRFYILFTIFICLASVVVGFGSFAVLGCKDLWNNANYLAKWYGHVQGSRFQVFFLFVTYSIIQDIISSEM